MLLHLHHYYPCFSSKAVDSVPLFPPLSSLRTYFSLRNSRPSFIPNANCKSVSDAAIQRIAEKLTNLGYLEDTHEAYRAENGGGSPGEIFIPLPKRLPARRVGYTIDGSLSTPGNPVPYLGSGIVKARYSRLNGDLNQLKKLTERSKSENEKTMVPPTLAELALPEVELKRLRSIGIGLRKKIVVGKAGITEGVVNGIHERWRHSELVKVKCEDLCRINMKRTHDTLEKKTGGLVVWRSGSIIILYRGANYSYPYFLADNLKGDVHNAGFISFQALSNDVEIDHEDISLDMICPQQSIKPISSSQGLASSSLVFGVGSPKKVRFRLPGEMEFDEEADSIVADLGPRFTDWWGPNPLPVDADLLPGTVAGYLKPFRLLPYGINPKLTNKEITLLRRLGRPVPCHFALGRNKNLQGLAKSIIELWKKCEIAKIAVKRGVQNTNSQMMAEELKQLTGGTLVSRDKDFIVLYRGKDFLPPAVADAIEDRRNVRFHVDKLRMDSDSSVKSSINSEFTTEKGSLVDESQTLNGERSACTSKDRKPGLSVAHRSLDAKLSQALERKSRTEGILEKLDQFTEAQEADKEGITEEERYMLRKVGLRMKAFLPMGRRGVFDGTIENMHLHWKYRELVKVISKEKSINDVYRVAHSLEAESGGILVAVERVGNAHAIIVYRGKNYCRPTYLRPKTLINKRQATKRSIEADRYQSLKLHVLELTKKINHLEQRLVNYVTVGNHIQQIANEDATIEYDSCGSIQRKSSHNEIEDEVPVVIQLQDSNYKDACLSKSEIHVPPSDPSRKQDDISFHKDEMLELIEARVHCKTTQLLNKERLLLRKQALKMKKRPVLAIGRSNAITGAVKAINMHFKKNFLAIVNVKGRAKGTTVEEVTFQLEQATGAVLVSREPNKIILFRGWLEGETASDIAPKVKPAGTKTFNRGKGWQEVSPQLVMAIRAECGLPAQQEHMHLWEN